MVSIEDLDDAHPHLRMGWNVGTSLLKQTGYEPEKVYAFLTALEGHPEVTNFSVENITTHAFVPALKAEYLGDLPWGGKNDSNVADDEFNRTASEVFESLKVHTGYDMDKIKAYPTRHSEHAHITAKVDLGSRTLSMIIRKAEQ